MHTRVTGIVIEDGKLLLLNQDTDSPRSWSLPSGPVPREQHDPGDQPHTTIGAFTCDQVPGSLRLSRSNGERLNSMNPMLYTGTGYTLTLLEPAGTEGTSVTSFVLGLDRAPGLHFQAG
ncbi:hypothetical protein [Streptomyces sp. NPDC092903]|uniref:hypothetical protein n=1 Tax=Streptomyces sp. NPDC092903 TaxID=3366017 RepID=UPI003812B34D